MSAHQMSRLAVRLPNAPCDAIQNPGPIQWLIPAFSGLAHGKGKPYNLRMAETATPFVLPVTGKKEKTDPHEARDRGYVVICWNDPVNLMDFVTHVFQSVFGWPKIKARRHMLQVHELGKSLLARDTFEKAEHYVHQLQSYGLHATMEREE
jgi:ATP-dependent Clp protease adaptor protein ClpS